MPTNAKSLAKTAYNAAKSLKRLLCKNKAFEMFYYTHIAPRILRLQSVERKEGSFSQYNQDIFVLDYYQRRINGGGGRVPTIRTTTLAQI